MIPLSVFALAGSGSSGAALTADRIVHNGQIVTVDSNFRIAEALAIRFSSAGSEILAVGSNAEVMALRGPNTQLTDLQGRVVIPGLIDSHLHFSLLGIEAAFEADLRRAMSLSDIVQGIARLAGRRRPAPGEWLVGRGWDEYKYERPFTRWDIDAVVPNNPVQLERVYRGLAVNTAVFQRMGIRDPKGIPMSWFTTTKTRRRITRGGSAEYDPPFGLTYSTGFMGQTGNYYDRRAQMRNALNSTVTITVEGRAGRYPWVKLWDNRVAKTFRIGDRHSIEGIFDWFNTLNSSAVLAQVTTNGPDYGKPTSIISPRIFRLGARWKF